MNTMLSIKISLRGLRKRPGFSAVVICTIALVLGTSIVVYSYLDALLFTSLPFKDSDRLVRIHSVKGGEPGLLSYPEFLDMQKELRSIEELAVYREGGRYNLSGDGKAPEDLTVTFASSNLFKLLGVDPMLGDHWPETLDKRGSHTVMLTHEFWQRRFDGKEEIEGLEITLDGFSYSNYGVLPEGFSFPGKVEAFRAMAFADFVVDSRDFRPCIGLAKLRADVSISQFNDELKTYSAQQEARHLKSNLGLTFVAEPLADLFIGNLTRYLLLVGAAVFFLLIIAIVNVSNLVISHAVRRGREMVVRKVLGSSNLAILKGFVLNSLVLSLIGCVVGLLIAAILINASNDLLKPYLPYWIKVTINSGVVLYAIFVTIVVGLATGFVPWLFLSRAQLSSRQKDGQQTTGNKKQLLLQKGLAVLQVFACVILLVGGSLLLKSFKAAENGDLGYESDKKLTFRIALSWFKYGGHEKKQTFFESSLRSIEKIPGVKAVTMNSILPLTERVSTSTDSQSLITAEGQSEQEQSTNPFVSLQRVTPNYFDVMDVKMLKGAGFHSSNHQLNDSKVIIDESLAHQLWPGESPVGKRIKMGNHQSDKPFLTITGIVENVKHQSITSENIPSVYVSLLSYSTTDAHYVIQSDLSLSELQPRLSNAILTLDENQPTFEFMYMSDHIENANWQSKVSSTLFMTVAIIGSVIAAIGLFSMMSFILALKVKEFALRKVLGADERRIILLILKELLSMSGVGIGIGLLLTPAILRPILPFLYQVDLVDKVIYSALVGALVLLSLIAALAPTWKAMYINPVTVLRKD